MLWGYLDQNRYFYHVKLARMTSKIWNNHQVKDCASWNAKVEQPVLECHGGHGEIQQIVPVRFYGNTRRDLDPETLRFHCARKARNLALPSAASSLPSRRCSSNRSKHRFPLLTERR
jgi:hypothetical protein